MVANSERRTSALGLCYQMFCAARENPPEKSTESQTSRFARKGYVKAYELEYGDRFWFEDLLWQHCGWYSAVQHIAAINLRTGEKRVVAHVQPVKIYEETFFGGLGI